jgi:hypothetical protein
VVVLGSGLSLSNPTLPKAAAVTASYTINRDTTAHNLRVTDTCGTSRLGNGPLEQRTDLQVFERDPAKIPQDALMEA